MTYGELIKKPNYVNNLLVNYIEKSFFSQDDLTVIVTCFADKGWTGTRIAKEFPCKQWNYRSIIRVLAKYRHTGTIPIARKAAEDP